ncbi:MAG: pilus assembly PilX family protein [Cellulomonas sp.]
MARTTRAIGAVLRERIRLARRDAESGIALVLVIGSMLVLAMLAMTALAYTMQSEKFARYTQDYSSAITTAQSGVEDYISRLNRNDQYGRTVDCTNAALRGPMAPSTNACGWTMSTPVGWLPVVPGETNPDAAWYHVAVNASNAANGELNLTVTGRVNGEYRSVDSTVGKGGSTDYVYYTDFESADPANVQAYSPSGATVAACGAGGYANARYFYNGRSGAGCVEITFISADTLDGAVFTNDAILSSGATFTDGVETAYPTCSTATSSSSTWNRCLRSGSTANFNSIKPEVSAPKYLDDTSAAFVSNPGCHYYGSTRVIFKADGTMTVWNKTVNNGGLAPVAIAAPTGATPSCGTVATLNAVAGANLPVPDELVLYVGTAPTSVVRRQCNSGEIGGASGKTLPLGTYDRALIPGTLNGGTSYTYTYDTNMTESTKFCAEGNLYLEGTLNGRVTVAAAQSVIVTGDIVLAGTINGDDMLGLVATNSVDVYGPRLATYSVLNRNTACVDSGTRSYRYCPGTTSTVAGWPTRYPDPTYSRNEPATGIQIAGSIQTLQHSFLVQKYDEGSPRGELQVNGSIAQRWRGIVGRGSGGSMTGYTKLYQYDTRLIFAPPPYFPRWANSQWSLRYSGEINTPTTARN